MSGHEPGGAPIERERGRRHAGTSDGDQPIQSILVLLFYQCDRIRRATSGRPICMRAAACLGTKRPSEFATLLDLRMLVLHDFVLFIFVQPNRSRAYLIGLV